MWIVFAVISSLSLGFYDVFKKRALEGNNVYIVLLLNTLLCSLFMSPVLFAMAGGCDSAFGRLTFADHRYIILKSVIVTASWLLGYWVIKKLPLTITGSVNALRPVLVLTGALILFGEHPNALQWTGIALGFVSLLWVGFIGSREGLSQSSRKWLVMGLLSVVLWAASGLYDKFLLERFTPLAVEAWYSFYQLVIMSVVVGLLLLRSHRADRDPFRWKWSILFISVFIALADLSYFMALSIPGSLVGVVSMTRRGSALVSFFYGIFILRERNMKLKIVDLLILVAGVACLIAGSLDMD